MKRCHFDIWNESFAIIAAIVETLRTPSPRRVWHHQGMDTAAAAAAAVVVDLSTEGGSKSSATKTKLLNKPQPKSKSKSSYTRVGTAVGVASIATSCSELDIANCLGSTVESMSATPPTTPTRMRGNSNETGEVLGMGMGMGMATGNGEAHGHVMSMNGLKDAIADRDCHQEIALAPLIATTTSTSSTNASTTPTSALLTPTAPTVTPATTTTTATAITQTTTLSSSSSSTTTMTTSSSSSGTAKIGEDNNNIDQLLHWQDMPKYLQFNPYVLKGYRPLQTFKGCLLSLFYWHNETINILTHGES
ncbi:hypothetical protein ACLKA6_017591 [Drosophila palustris]